MLTDLPPLDPCPVTAKGRHHLAAVLPETSDGDMTLFCELCGTVRRMPVAGAIVSESLDRLTRDEVRALFE